jgi:hypothetical protein
MVVVWAVFAGTALLLAACGFIAGRIKGEMTPVFRTIRRFLLAMAVGTTLFPTFLQQVGPMVWAGLYVAFVVVVTGIMTGSAVAAPRAVSGRSA